jgi:hypothetical protein
MHCGFAVDAEDWIAQCLRCVSFLAWSNAVTAFESWIDRVEVRTDVATAAPVRALAATLEGPV